LLRIKIVENGDDGMTKWLKSLLAFSALIASLIFVDYVLPFNEREHEVKDMVVRDGFSEVEYELYLKMKVRYGEEEFWLILEGEELAVHESDLEKIRRGDIIILYSTKIFGINVKGINKSNPNGEIRPFFDVYGFFIFIPFVFLLLFGLMIYFRNNSEVIMTIGVINIILLIGFGALLLFY
jgi:hypothetical protein